MFKRLIASLIILTFSCTTITIPQARAAENLNLPTPGTMVNLSPAFEPTLIKGLTVHKDNPFLFDFVVDTGHSGLQGKELKKEGDRLVKYFFAALTVPEKDLWVNLSPYEKDRMVPEALGKTALGRDLLAQDYILKQLTASLIYPEKDLGKEFWDRVYAKAQAMYGNAQIPVNTFNKVWILADKATVYEHGQTAFVVGGHLKVMLEEDYLAMNKHINTSKDKTNNIGSQLVREIVLPEIEKEVYTDKNTVKGVNLSDPSVKEQIYQQYLKAYKKGVFNYIKEDAQANGQSVPRKYFSGGYGVNPSMLSVTHDSDKASVAARPTGTDFAMEVMLDINRQPDSAMASKRWLDAETGIALIVIASLLGWTGYTFVQDHKQRSILTENSRAWASKQGLSNHNFTVYPVRKSDTIASIVALTGIKEDILKEANNLTNDKDLLGRQGLILPGITYYNINISDHNETAKEIAAMVYGTSESAFRVSVEHYEEGEIYPHGNPVLGKIPGEDAIHASGYYTESELKRLKEEVIPNLLTGKEGLLRLKMRDDKPIPPPVKPDGAMTSEKKQSSDAAMLSEIRNFKELIDQQYQLALEIKLKADDKSNIVLNNFRKALNQLRESLSFVLTEVNGDINVLLASHLVQAITTFRGSDSVRAIQGAYDNDLADLIQPMLAEILPQANDLKRLIEFSKIPEAPSTSITSDAAMLTESLLITNLNRSQFPQIAQSLIRVFKQSPIVNIYFGIRTNGIQNGFPEDRIIDFLHELKTKVDRDGRVRVNVEMDDNLSQLGGYIPLKGKVMTALFDILSKGMILDDQEVSKRFSDAAMKAKEVNLASKNLKEFEFQVNHKRVQKTIVLRFTEDGQRRQIVGRVTSFRIVDSTNGQFLFGISINNEPELIFFSTDSKRSEGQYITGVHPQMWILPEPKSRTQSLDEAMISQVKELRDLLNSQIKDKKIDDSYTDRFNEHLKRFKAELDQWLDEVSKDNVNLGHGIDIVNIISNYTKVWPWGDGLKLRGFDPTLIEIKAQETINQLRVEPTLERAEQFRIPEQSKLNTPITSIGLNEIITLRLENRGVKTVKDLVRIPKKELRTYELGIDSVELIENLLRGLGFALGGYRIRKIDVDKEKTLRELLDKRIYDKSTGLTSRTSNALESGQVYTIADLVRKNLSELRQIRFLGEVSIKNIEESLTKMGLAFDSYALEKIDFEEVEDGASQVSNTRPPEERSTLIPNSNRDEFLKLSIDKLGLSTRVNSVLKSGGIITIGNLVDKKRRELLGFKNLGQRSLDVVERSLAKLGLNLKYDIKMTVTEGPQEPSTILNTDISVLDLSIRTSNALTTGEINTIGDLVSKSEKELLKIRSFGKGSLREVKRRLADNGLELKRVLSDKSADQKPQDTDAAMAAGNSPEDIRNALNQIPFEVRNHKGPIAIMGNSFQLPDEKNLIANLFAIFTPTRLEQQKPGFFASLGEKNYKNLTETMYVANFDGVLLFADINTTLQQIKEQLEQNRNLTHVRAYVWEKNSKKETLEEYKKRLKEYSLINKNGPVVGADNEEKLIIFFNGEDISDKAMAAAVSKASLDVTMAAKINKAVVAQRLPPGGIDLNTANMGITVTKDANGGVKVNFDPAMIERIKVQGVFSADPIIIRITPMNLTEIRPLLGLKDSDESEKLAKV